MSRVEQSPRTTTGEGTTIPGNEHRGAFRHLMHAVRIEVYSVIAPVLARREDPAPCRDD